MRNRSANSLGPAQEGEGGAEETDALLGDRKKSPAHHPGDSPLHPAGGSSKPQRGEDHNLLQALVTVDFWLIYLAMTLASGSGLTALNNLGQIGRSLGYEQGAIGVFVSLMSIWNFLGRVGGGYLSEYFVQKYGSPRPLFMVLTQAVMAVGHVLFAAAFPGSIFLASILVGLTYGAQWGLMPAVASELFGLRYFSTMYNWLTITNPTGSYLLSVCVAGYLYDEEAEKEYKESPPSPVSPPPGESGPLACHGPHCFRVTFIIMACACVAASCSSFILMLLSRPFYAAEHAKRQAHLEGSSSAIADEGAHSKS